MGVTVSQKAPRIFNDSVVAAVCVCGPGLVTLIPMAAASAMPAMAASFYPHGGGAFFAQMVMTLPALALVVAAPLAGLLAEKIGQRTVLLAALVLYLMGGVGALMASGAALLIAARLLLGVAGGGVLTGCLTLIGLYFSGHQRERVLGFGVALSSSVAAVALSLGGRMVDMFGWRGPFAFYILAIPVFLVTYVVIRPVRTLSVARATRAEALSSLTSLGRLTPYYLLIMLFTVGMFTPSIQGPFLIQTDGINSASIQGSIVSTSSIVAIFSAASYGFMRRAIAINWMLVIVSASFGCAITALSVLHGGWIAVGSAIAGLGAGLAEATVASAILMRAPSSVHGRALGLLVSALFLGQWLNPLVFTPLRFAYGIRGAMTIVGGSFLTLAVGIALINLRRPSFQDGG